MRNNAGLSVPLHNFIGVDEAIISTILDRISLDFSYEYLEIFRINMIYGCASIVGHWSTYLERFSSR